MTFTTNLFRPDANVPEIARNVLAWVVDLETTTAKQGIGRLCFDNRYDCLGRGCEVLGMERIESVSGIVVYGESMGYLSDYAVTMFGLNGPIGRFSPMTIGEKQVDCLLDLNDILRWSFPQIAAFIRGSWELQFRKPLEESA